MYSNIHISFNSFRVTDWSSCPWFWRWLWRFQLT